MLKSLPGSVKRTISSKLTGFIDLMNEATDPLLGGIYRSSTFWKGTGPMYEDAKTPQHNPERDYVAKQRAFSNANQASNIHQDLSDRLQPPESGYSEKFLSLSKECDNYITEINHNLFQFMDRTGLYPQGSPTASGSIAETAPQPNGPFQAHEMQLYSQIQNLRAILQLQMNILNRI